MIKTKTIDEIKLMRETGRVVARVLKKICQAVSPGITTIFLDKMAESLCRKMGAIPAFKGYHGYPYSLCCSLNEEVVHGLPNKKRLQEGDIISMDFGCIRDGFYGDAAATVAVGEISAKAIKLIQVTEAALIAGINHMKPGNRLGDISAAVQQVVEAGGYSVVRQFVGHGIGRFLHEDPRIPNFGSPGRGVELKSGMVFAIEPMVNIGTYEVKILKDGWTVVTADGELSAHFEHTVAITDSGPKILSLL